MGIDNSNPYIHATTVHVIAIAQNAAKIHSGSLSTLNIFDNHHIVSPISKIKTQAVFFIIILLFWYPLPVYPAQM